ncbi:MAG: glycogen debranching protein GlgX [Dermatophilaceae bacterium]|nr:glycogen debranching protein GlgX [Dermatophilaceae bacterium]
MSTSGDLPPDLGATLTREGVDFAVYAGHADAVEICLFEPGDTTGASERRVQLKNRTHGTWFGSVPGLRAGARYGVRVHGPWQPDQGLRHNPDKLLMDPYARAIEGQVTWRPEVFGHVVDDRLDGDPDVRDRRNSAAYLPRAVVVDNHFDWGDDCPPQVPWAATVIYEAHVRNLTKLHPGIPEPLRGTYAGMAHPATIEHLLALGVTAVELQPVHAFSHEPHLVGRGLTNHWGYNTLGFNAPHSAYAAAGDPQGALDEFKGMVKLLHAAGLEVILDVVYNHTCEQGRDGATLSWRGLDNRAYYRLDERGHDIDVTGCGNTLDLRHPMVARMVLDSLRYWVELCHVDGFRFDLAVALGRGRDDGYYPNHSFLVALRTDPVLSRVKLIAEPWDLGVHGWRTGQFPPPFAEWNDRFRDAVRTFWLTDVARSTRHEPGHGVRDLATRLSGSEDLFGRRDRGPTASINYVTAHDGFTLADTTAYDRKHNAANGEGNQDGSDDNRSWNHGIEGTPAPPQSGVPQSGAPRSGAPDSGAPESGVPQPGVPESDTTSALLTMRRRSIRNLLATELLASGVPMINAGDEFGRSQGGNNNTYCQDNEVSWFSWDLETWQEDLLVTTRFLTTLRGSTPVLGQRFFFPGRRMLRDGVADLQWFATDGVPMRYRTWDDPRTRTLAMFLDGTHVGGQSLLIYFHGDAQETEVILPTQASGATYRLIWDSTWERPLPSGQGQDAQRLADPEPASRPRPDGSVTLAATSIRVYGIDR